MNVTDLTKAEIQAICRKQEGQFYEKKSILAKSSKIQKVAVAFGNAEGGEILIGLNDEKISNNPDDCWHGHDNMEKFNPYIQALNEINPPLEFDYRFLRNPTKGTLILEILIPKSDKISACPDGGVYIRKNAQTIKIIDPEIIQSLSFAKGQKSYENQNCLDATLDDITDSSEFKNFLSQLSPTIQPLDYLQKQRFIDKKTLIPKVSGILLFNDNPGSIIGRKCAIKIARYTTSETEGEREHLEGNIGTIEGPLYKQIKKTVTEIEKIFIETKIFNDNKLQQVRYPPETIFEILVNAVIHRDYSISDDIKVLIYDNRIEIISPGRLPAFISPDNILENRYSRNPQIVKTLHSYVDPPNKDIGEGLRTAFQKMTEFNLVPPKIEQQGNYVKVIIEHTPLAKPEETILDYLKDHEYITNSIARELTGIKSENKMKAVFYKLRDARLITLGKNNRWHSLGKKNPQLQMGFAFEDQNL